jgi:putative tributyrin esterase
MNLKPIPFFSGALHRRETCFVYLPPGYDSSDVSYPVVYLLHGMYGCEADWSQKGKAHETAERLIKAGDLRECIVVMPNDGRYGQGTFYVNWYDGSGNFEDYIVDDLIPFIDGHYRTVAAREHRAVCGLSMGGYGAFQLALRHPDLFGSAASLSGALGSVTAMGYESFSRSELSRLVGPQHGLYVREYDLYQLSAKAMDQAIKPALYFDCGREDFLYEDNVRFKSHLRQIDYPVEFNEYPGAHTWDYWTQHLVDALLFIEKRFGDAGSSE